MDSRVSARALAGALGGWRTRDPAYEALADSTPLTGEQRRARSGLLSRQLTLN